MEAQATSFYALDTLGVSHLDRKDPLGGQQVKEGQKNFKRMASSPNTLVYWYFSAMRERLGSPQPHSGSSFLGSFGRCCGTAIAKGPA